MTKITKSERKGKNEKEVRK